jgi:iron complex transport system substrate-binding protein
MRGKPVVVRSALTPREIDTAVSERIRAGDSLYEINEVFLRELAPTHILTQDLCNVCAPTTREISRAIETLPSNAPELSNSPR